MKRRRFLAFCTFAGASVLLQASPPHYARPVKLYQEPYQTMALLHNDLMSGSGIAGILNNINAVSYLRGVFEDPHIDESERVFLKNGVLWLNETAQERHQVPYYRLQPPERQNLLTHIATERWGENWLYAVMGYFFEAMLGDPLYGGNAQEAGWHYLNHHGGLPRPEVPYL